MAVRRLIMYPSEQLRQVVKPVVDFAASELRELVSGLKKTLRASKGLGLAATQVGEFRRVVVINTRDGVLALVNPNITEHSQDVEVGEEGCLSVPGVYGLVARALNIDVRAQTVSGETMAFRADGLFARVIQHEVDHLNGILFIDRVQKFTAGAALLQELWNKFGRDRKVRPTVPKR